MAQQNSWNTLPQLQEGQADRARITEANHCEFDSWDGTADYELRHCCGDDIRSADAENNVPWWQLLRSLAIIYTQRQVLSHET